ncbi:MAG: radical SAM family heme chaperone HemW [Xanthomonadales bacterium]|nr:radical SAM family heme chaperone HemW [Xanthomonadales bacterium]
MRMVKTELPPLGLYVHLPWCVSKCPYCDFNSHALREKLPAEAYIRCLLEDLQGEVSRAGAREVSHVYLGGGTPSLFSAQQVEMLLTGLAGHAPIAPDAEITLEANPGTVEHDAFEGYRDAGINRVSLGVQSFDNEGLQRIGRIHGRDEAERALESLRSSGIASFNVDLMFGLPGQSLRGAAEDIRIALDSGASHVSHYRLTLEPNTAFHASPPSLPSDDMSWDMQESAVQMLERAGFEQYEISAWARPGHQCRHNLNYWRYGDYLAIGAGAHGKLTTADGAVERIAKSRHPARYLAGDYVAERWRVSAAERVFEFFLNQFRLRETVTPGRFESRTGLHFDGVRDRLDNALGSGLLERDGDGYRHSEAGWRFVNDLQALFLP